MRYKLTVLLFLCISSLFAQLTPKNYTTTPAYIICGQSNGDNFWDYSSYNVGGQGARHSLRLADTLESIWGVPTVNVFYHSPAGHFLCEKSGLVDWSVNSAQEDYEYVMKMYSSDTIRNASNKFPSFAKEGGVLYDLKFLIWIQGENDASENDCSTAYYDNLKALIKRFRNDLQKPNLPVFIIRLNDDINRGSLAGVRNAQTLIGTEDAYTWTIDIDDFDAQGADYTSPGNVHYSYSGLNKILTRLIAIIRDNNL